MMKKYFKQTIALLIAAVLFGTSSPAAFTYDELDSKTAVAGASVALSRYLENNKDAANVLKMLLPTVENTAVFRDKGAVDPAEAEGEILYKETFEPEDYREQIMAEKVAEFLVENAAS